MRPYEKPNFAARQLASTKGNIVAYDFTLFTERQRLFCEEWVIDLNLDRASKAAGYANGSVGRACLQVKHCLDYIDHLNERRAKRLEIRQDDVLSRLWNIATADVNELVQYRRNACRYCYGSKYRYQWTDAELERAQEEAEKRGLPKPKAPGGPGFDKTRDPNPACPECRGEGAGHIHANDTRKLSAQGKMLYAGVKSGRDGLEIKSHDQVKALELVGKHLGMFKDKVEHSGEIKNTAPVLNLMLTGPEAKPAAEVPQAPTE